MDPRISDFRPTKHRWPDAHPAVSAAEEHLDDLRYRHRPLRVPAFTRHEINTFTAGFALGVMTMSAAVCVWTYFL